MKLTQNQSSNPEKQSLKRSSFASKQVNHSTIQPTHKQAVEIMLRAITDKQRLVNLAYWRERYGDEFVNRVAEDVERKK